MPPNGSCSEANAHHTIVSEASPISRRVDVRDESKADIGRRRKQVCFRPGRASTLKMRCPPGAGKRHRAQEIRCTFWLHTQKRWISQRLNPSRGVISSLGVGLIMELI